MSTKFSSTPNSSLARFIGALLVTVFCTFALGFAVWSVVSFGAPWGILLLIGVPYLIATPIFARGTLDNWRDYKRLLMLAGHGGDLSSILAGHISTYYVEMGRPQSFWFELFFHWLDEQQSSLDTGNILDALNELEEAGEVSIYRPESGGLLISLTPQFRRRQVFAIAPQRD